MVEFLLSYTGKSAENHELDFYDVARALIGFQRSLAITTHLVLNGQVIVKAPALKNARIVAIPPEQGSWTIKAGIVVGFALGHQALTAPPDTVLGHLAHSAYDYVISESLGFHVDYEKSLGQSYKELKETENTLPILQQSQFDSVIEKCQPAIRDIHLPIAKSETAETASISSIHNQNVKKLTGSFTYATYDYMEEMIEDSNEITIKGRVSSYNANTFKGRIFVPAEGRPIPFDIKRNSRFASKIVESLEKYVNGDTNHLIELQVWCYRTKQGQLKSYYVIE
ncbi:MAG: hypothetical protein K0U39_03010 [Alphaproteobacteria bacterium]|nr:hypothetical protein [Alphaproteobacteria bacterium]